MSVVITKTAVPKQSIGTQSVREGVISQSAAKETKQSLSAITTSATTTISGGGTQYLVSQIAAVSEQLRNEQPPLAIEVDDDDQTQSQPTSKGALVEQETLDEFLEMEQVRTKEKSTSEEETKNLQRKKYEQARLEAVQQSRTAVEKHDSNVKSICLDQFQTPDLLFLHFQHEIFSQLNVDNRPVSDIPQDITDEVKSILVKLNCLSVGKVNRYFERSEKIAK
jgi:hypothetical protein